MNETPGARLDRALALEDPLARWEALGPLSKEITAEIARARGRIVLELVDEHGSLVEAARLLGVTAARCGQLTKGIQNDRTEHAPGD